MWITTSPGTTYKLNYINEQEEISHGDNTPAQPPANNLSREEKTLDYQYRSTLNTTISGKNQEPLESVDQHMTNLFNFVLKLRIRLCS